MSSLYSYSRAQPSPRYRELLALYRDMHLHGETARNRKPDETYDGKSLPRQAETVKMLVREFNAETILDYGSGKGRAHRQPFHAPDGQVFANIGDYWGVTTVTCYDPAYTPFSELPRVKFDGAIATDVLEHCPEEDLPWILEEIFGFARKFVFANVACYPALAVLPNGENAHCTIRPVTWWQAAIAAGMRHYPDLAFLFLFDTQVQEPDGSVSSQQVILTNGQLVEA